MTDSNLNQTPDWNSPGKKPATYPAKTVFGGMPPRVMDLPMRKPDDHGTGGKPAPDPVKTFSGGVPPRMMNLPTRNPDGNGTGRDPADPLKTVFGDMPAPPTTNLPLYIPPGRTTGRKPADLEKTISGNTTPRISAGNNTGRKPAADSLKTVFGGEPPLRTMDLPIRLQDGSGTGRKLVAETPDIVSSDVPPPRRMTWATRGAARGNRSLTESSAFGKRREDTPWNKKSWRNVPEPMTPQGPAVASLSLWPTMTPNAMSVEEALAVKNVTEHLEPTTPQGPAATTPSHWSTMGPITKSVEEALSVKNVTELPKEQRLGLLEGEKVLIFFGDVQVDTMPLLLLLAFSSTAKTLYTEEQALTRFDFATHLAKSSVFFLIDWMKKTVQRHNPYRMPRADVLWADLSVIRVAHALGMQLYVEHIFNRYWAAFKKERPTFDRISTTLQVSHDDDEPFLKCLVGRLADIEYRNDFPDDEDREAYDAYMRTHPRIVRLVKPKYEGLVEARRVVEEQMAERQRKRAEQEALRGGRQAMDQIEADRVAKEAAARKVAQGRIGTVTVEEARFLPGGRGNGAGNY
ncbi:hypothetical protein BDV95DRAFT_603159 [Massariosphaeria phaeospora]|uniref:Uncharacterized protein n=1 Tax=Massariosphaeria phaeospora TaxID=100035 RepID=A0A7C8MDH5_9PLEO|nr:hypothetical protein BDV95DRAFT_603159 [Massariosphaeria phaeospora]